MDGVAVGLACPPWEVAQSLGAIDGMASRRAQRGRAGGAVLQVVTAWATEEAVALRQVGAEPYTNETVVMPHLIDSLELNGASVTSDAAGCHAHIVEPIVANVWKYVLTLKANQPTLYLRVREYLMAMGERGKLSRLPRCCQQDRGHGRRETRCATATPAPAEIRALPGWQSIRTIALATTETICQCSGRGIEHVGYHVSSNEPDADPMRRHFVSAGRPRTSCTGAWISHFGRSRCAFGVWCQRRRRH